MLETRVSTKDGSVIDINGWMARATLEMLGQAGLGHSFDDFTEDSIDSYGEALKMFLCVNLRSFVDIDANVNFTDATQSCPGTPSAPDGLRS